MKRKVTSIKEKPPVKEIPEKELVRAAINAPSDEFELGGRKFKIVDLPYDDYLQFVQYLAPFIDGVASRLIGSKLGISIPGMDLGAALTASKVLELCGNQLPFMAQIVCRQTEPDITVEEIKKLAGKPTALVNPVVRQLISNNVLADFSSFFAQLTMILPSQK